jgi:hypothetical protein
MAANSGPPPNLPEPAGPITNLGVPPNFDAPNDKTIPGEISRLKALGKSGNDLNKGLVKKYHGRYGRVLPTPAKPVYKDPLCGLLK